MFQNKPDENVSDFNFDERSNFNKGLNMITPNYTSISQ
jgi:hypothetical protein